MINKVGATRDRFFPHSLRSLLKRILNEEKSGSIFGIDNQFFFKPKKNDPMRMNFNGKWLDTPFGLAAGPHTQLAQNIVSGWITGARYIELKTVQVLDEIDVAKPCIDMRDEGYNCEWSQELSIEDSLKEYLKAWILIHILKSRSDNEKLADIGTVFNMSAGYDLKGVKSEKVTGFLSGMRNCNSWKREMLEEVKEIYPEVSSIEIPDLISDNITISTMHGTPPEEIEAIGRYFISDAGLNTVIKLNPTLLGRDEVRKILNDTQNFDAIVPDSAFDHDPKFDEAVKIIGNLKRVADSKGLFFGIKLTNTLETVNKSTSLPSGEEMVYLSGRALHPIAVSLAFKLREAVGDEINISFSAGADTFNIPKLILSGLKPVTVASDILKPGGYTRLAQYVEELRKNAPIMPKPFSRGLTENLSKYKDEVLSDPRYRKDYLKKNSEKGVRRLDLFDCIYPPCMEECAATQDIPGYLKLTAEKQFKDGYRKVVETNPLPSVTGLVCDHKCQIRCTREFYDETVRIKDIKYFLSGYGDKINREYGGEKIKDLKVAVVGAGPAGISCTHYLSSAGVDVTVYEKSESAGGMVDKVIPPFRLGEESLVTDLKRMDFDKLNIKYGIKVDRDFLDNLRKENDFVFFATGTDNSIRLKIKGIESQGVVPPLELLRELKSGKEPPLGTKVAVIGGGNTAFDVARSVKKYKGSASEVTVLYRRSSREMPAEPEEIRAAISEGVNIEVLTVPEEVISEDGRVKGLVCSRTELTGIGKDGRPYPKKIEGTEFSLFFDSIVPALGQKSDLEELGLEPGNIPGFKNILRDGNVIIGGDCGLGDKTVINAIGDGRRVAEFITENLSFAPEKTQEISKDEYNELVGKRAVRIYSNLKPGERSVTEETAVKEAERCLQCDKLCDLCVTVCPNRANVSYPGETGIFTIPEFDKNSGEVIFRSFEIKQNRQILHIPDLCNHCGNCTTFCPTSGEPFKDKPRLAIRKESYDIDDNVFFLSEDLPEKTLLRKRGDVEEKLVMNSDKFHYSGPDVDVTLSQKGLEVIKIEKKKGALSDIDSESLFSMIYLLKNIPAYLT